MLKLVGATSSKSFLVRSRDWGVGRRFGLPMFFPRHIRLPFIVTSATFGERLCIHLRGLSVCLPNSESYKQMLTKFGE